jgi:predicted amidohydrolase
MRRGERRRITAKFVKTTDGTIVRITKRSSGEVAAMSAARDKEASMEREPVRQGDVLLIPVDNVPADAKRKRRTKRGIVLAEGEATGHAHVVTEPSATEYHLKGRRYLLAAEGVTIQHDEHDTLTLDPGAWEIIGQYEYAPEAIRRVAD